METKICKTCMIEKNISEFRVSNGHIRGDCKKCENQKSRTRNAKNAEHIKEKQKEYRQLHKEEIRQYKKEHYNAEEKKIYNAEYRKNHKEYYSNWHKQYRKTHKKQLQKIYNEWKKKNPDKIRQYQKKDSERRKQNPTLKVELQLRNMLNTAFKRRGYVKNDKLKDIVGMTSKEMVKYLLNTFKENYGYEWDNKEKVHIDHIIPLKSCNTIEEVYKACHYTNLQLLKASDNLSKGARIDWNLKER